MVLSMTSPLVEMGWHLRVHLTPRGELSLAILLHLMTRMIADGSNMGVDSMPQVIRSRVGRFSSLHLLSTTIFGLVAPSPNPFTDHAMLSYTLHHSSHVSLEIYDPIGRLVTKLIDKEVGAGKHTTEFKAGANAIPGVYLCKLVSGDGVALGKMVLVR